MSGPVKAGVIVLILLLPVALLAAVPHQFQPNTPISSAEVNENFASLDQAVGNRGDAYTTAGTSGSLTLANVPGNYVAFAKVTFANNTSPCPSERPVCTLTTSSGSDSVQAAVDLCLLSPQGGAQSGGPRESVNLTTAGSGPAVLNCTGFQVGFVTESKITAITVNAVHVQ